MKNLRNILFIVCAVTLIALGVSYAETSRLGNKYPIQFNPSKVVAKTAAYTLVAADSQVEVTAASANITITLPSINSVTTGGTKAYKIIKKDATAYKIVVTPATGETIGFESTRYLVGDEDFMVISASGGKNWSVDFESPYIVEDHEAGTYTTGIGSGGLLEMKTTSTTLTASSCGNTIAVATDAIVTTLPATAANCRITFMNTGAAGANILTINPNNADQIFGTVTLASSVVAIVGSAGDAVANTKATSIRGDSMTVVGDGVDGWYIESSTGIWADTN